MFNFLQKVKCIIS